ncbi:ABC transporter ATP-binding protein, partial [bacterium]|nr:ABC transporter ATP-binding protein [bacterium]
MGFFSGLDAEKYDRQYSDRKLFVRILSYFRPYTLQLSVVTVCMLLVSGASALQPVVVSRGLDSVGTQPTLSKVLWIGGLVLFLGILTWSMNWVRRRYTVRVVANVLKKLAGDAFSAATAHDLSFYDEFPSGKIASRITSDTLEFGNLVNLVTELISQVVESGILLVILLTINWKLTLIAIALMPLV